MSCRDSLSSNRVIRLMLGFGLLAASASSTAQDFDLVSHNGFEACWPKAITKPQFLAVQKATVDGMALCLPGLLGGNLGFTFQVCNTAACPNNMPGCPLTLRAGTFSGDFTPSAFPSEFSGPGTIDDITMPTSYSDGGATSGTCTIKITGITQTYSTFFYIEPDGNKGDYLAPISFSGAATFQTASISSADSICAAMLADPGPGLNGPGLIGFAESFPSNAVLAAFDANGPESVCPLTP